MTTTTGRDAFYAARDARADASVKETQRKALQALRDLQKAGEAVTIRAVARAAGLSDGTLYLDVHADVLAEVRRASRRPRQHRAAATPAPSSDYLAMKAQYLEAAAQVVELTQQNQALARKAGQASLAAAAAPTTQALEAGDAEQARLRAELVNARDETKKVRAELKAVQRELDESQEGRRQLIRSLSEVEAENKDLRQRLSGAKMSGAKQPAQAAASRRKQSSRRSAAAPTSGAAGEVDVIVETSPGTNLKITGLAKPK